MQCFCLHMMVSPLQKSHLEMEFIASYCFRLLQYLTVNLILMWFCIAQHQSDFLQEMSSS